MIEQKDMKMNNLILSLGFLLVISIMSSAGLYAQQRIEAEHVVIYSDDDRFAGWPANASAAIFPDDEILTGFIEGPYELQDGHNLGELYHAWLARSKDGGMTWTTGNPEKYVGDFGDKPELLVLDEPVNFLAPGFVMRVVGTAYHGADDPRGHFFYSLNKGGSWNGPYRINGMDWSFLNRYGLDELTPRTDYIVTGENECIFFISAREKGEFGTDRLFCIKTDDGGQSFNFLGWVIKPFQKDAPNKRKVELYENEEKNPYATECRAVMSSSLMLEDGTLLSSIRRKFIIRGGTDKHWIDLYSSMDGGKTWEFRSKVCDTGPHNGNPPAMELTADDRLCVAYGDRKNGTVNVIYSSDHGMTWSDPQILMDGFWSEDMEFNDLGYPRLFRRSDNKMVAVFYYSTAENPHHLRACIWSP